MKVSLLGMGLGTSDTLTVQARNLLQKTDYIIGAKRLVDSLPQDNTQNRAAAIDAAEILHLLMKSGAQQPCVIYSGDTGFYSGTRSLLPLLAAQNIETEVFAGISSVQYLAARLARCWQDWKLVSAHGTICEIVTHLSDSAPTFFLTGGTLKANDLCVQLAQAGLGTLHVTVGENLSYENEKISSGTAEEFAVCTFAPLSVLLVECVPRSFVQRTPGIEDALFIRGEVPMTKQEVRAVILAKLGIQAQMVCWDIGAGTGSVSVEMALQAKEVYAAECSGEAYRLMQQNKEKFGVWNLHLTQGTAPEVLCQFPSPDVVFIGGSGGKLAEILQDVHTINPQARVCIAAIALETVHTALTEMTALGYEIETVQIGVSRTKKAGDLHLLLAQNPIFLLTGVPQ